MKPREHRETGEQDLFRSRLDQIIDLRHPLVRLAHETDWAFLERTFGEAYRDGPGQPPLPTRLMAGRTHPARTTDQVFLSELTKAQAACAASLGRRQFQGSSS